MMECSVREHSYRVSAWEDAGERETSSTDRGPSQLKVGSSSAMADLTIGPGEPSLTSIMSSLFSLSCRSLPFSSTYTDKY